MGLWFLSDINRLAHLCAVSQPGGVCFLPYWIARASEAAQHPLRHPAMALETGTYISDLVDTNPAHTDGLDQADGHLRLIKGCILNTFKNWTDTSGVGSVGYLNSTQAQLDDAVNLLTGSSGAAAFPAGSVSAPSIAFTGDTDSGWYQVSASDEIALALNGVQQVLYTTTGETHTQPLTLDSTLSVTGQITGPGACPSGSIIMWGGAPSSLPTGWLLCNGASVSQTTYAALYTAIGTTYGNPGGGNFNLPNLASNVPLGYDSSNTISGSNTMGTVLGAAAITLTTSQCPTGLHTLNFSDPGHTHTVGPSGGGSVYVNQAGGNAPPSSGSQLNESGSLVASTVSTGITCTLTDHAGGGSHSNVQPCLVLAYIIKT